MKMRSLSSPSLSISRVRNLHLISAALAVTAAAVGDRVEPSCALPPLSLPLSAQALKSDRGGAARRRGAKRRTAEKTPTTIDHSNGGGERRGREREGTLCRKTSHQGRERAEVAPPPSSQSVIQSSKQVRAQQLCKVCMYVNGYNVTVKCVSQPSRIVETSVMNRRRLEPSVMTRTAGCGSDPETDIITSDTILIPQNYTLYSNSN